MLSQVAPTKENICAVVISHNPPQGFLLNIELLIEQVDKIVIVNSGLHKINFDFLAGAGFGPKVHLISNQQDLGQGNDLNQGVKWAISKDYQWALLMDQDSLANSSMVEELIKVYHIYPYPKKLGIIGSNCTYKNIGEIKYQKECKGKSYFERDVLMATGSLISLSAYQKTGSFREEFFIDSTDADYSLKLRKNGYKLIVACRAQLSHSIGEATKIFKFFGKRIPVTNHSPERCYYMARNGLILVKEYFFQEPYWAFRRIVWHLLVKPGLVILYEKDKIKKLKSMFLGLVHAFINKAGKYQQ